MNRKFLFLIITLTMILMFLSGKTRAETTFIYLAGVDDNFIAPSDAAAPSADVIRTFTNSGLVLQDFDLTLGLNNGSRDRHIVHTFTGLPANIVGAILEARVRAANDSWGVSSDGISLGFKDMNSQLWNDDLVWGRFFGDYNQHPGLIVQNREWDADDEGAFTLDLSSLKDHWGNTLNLIPDLNSRGFLDVVVNDDTAVDFYRLTVFLITIDDILNFFDDSVENDELYGYGTGWLAELRLRFMRLLLVIAGEFIENDRINGACIVLQRALMRCDGEPELRDFVEGPATGGIAEMIVDLMENHACD